MFNRSGVIALAVAAAIVVWGALHRDAPEPRPERTRPKVHAPTPVVASAKPDGGFDGK
jgi:hypothetical protein